MRYDEDEFGPCDCGEIEVWTGNAEITRNDAGVNIRHSRYQCREVKPKPKQPEGQGATKDYCKGG